MDSSISTLLIVAFAGLLLGVFAGLLIASLRSEPADEPERKEDSPPGGQPGKYTPVLRLWREKTSQALIVELDGKSYVSNEPLMPKQRDVVEKATGELAGWLGAVLAGPSESKPVEPRQPAAAQSAAGQAPVGVQPPPALRRDPAMITPPPAVQAPRLDLAQVINPVSNPAVKEESKSIVGQIDEILQEMLERAGFDNRGISLTEDPRKGVIVWMGLAHFEGIDAVTDPEIKAIIRSAVAEWERRQEANSLH